MSQLRPDPRVKPWDLVQPWDVEMLGEEILNTSERDRWEQAFAIGGGLAYIWQELARPISDVIYGLLELRPGDRVLIIGESVEPAGWREEMEAIVGPEGAVDAIEIIREGRAAIHGGKVGRNGLRGCWEWAYTYDTEDEAYDCVGVLQSTQHCDDWAATSTELLRVMKPGRRIVLAEAVLAGTTFHERVNADVHLRQWYEKLFLTIRPEDVPYYSGEELAQAFDGKLQDLRLMDWKGIEMLWGRKPARSPAEG
jgi:hypothetical protein